MLCKLGEARDRSDPVSPRWLSPFGHDRVSKNRKTARQHLGAPLQRPEMIPLLQTLLNPLHVVISVLHPLVRVDPRHAFLDVGCPVQPTSRVGERYLAVACVNRAI